MLYLCHKVDGDRMKKWFKENIAYIVSFSILSLIAVYYCNVYYASFNNSLPPDASTIEDYNLCISGGEPVNSTTSCEEIIISYERDYDLFYHFSYSIWEGSLFLPFFSFIFVMTPAIYSFVKKTKKGNIKNQLVRQNYSLFLKKEYKKSLKSIFILPGVLLIFLLFAGIYTSFKIGNPSVYQYYHVAIFKQILETPFLFITLLILTLMIQSVFLVNVAYIVCYYCKNLILTFLSCVIAFFILELSLECFYGVLIRIFSNASPNIFAVMLTSIWSYDGIDNLTVPLIINLIYAFISFFVMRKIYKSKEKMVMNCE